MSDRIAVRSVRFYGPRVDLTTEDARAEVLKRIKAWIAISGDKFVTGKSYGFGKPKTYNFYVAYFIANRRNIDVNIDWVDSVEEVVNCDEHMLCD